MKVMYHGTPREKVPIIQREGLRPLFNGVVHLTTSFVDAQAVCGACDPDEDIVVLVVDVEDLALEPGQDGPDTRTFPGVIDPHRIKEVRA